MLLSFSGAHHHSVDHYVGQSVSPFPPGPHSLGVVLQLGVPLFRPALVLGLQREVEEGTDYEVVLVRDSHGNVKLNAENE